MRYQLRPESLTFVDHAPLRLVFEGRVNASRQATFAALSADPTTWTRWFPGLTDGGYESDGPPGLGARRWVRMGRTGYRETMLAWDEPDRWTYRVDESSLPLARALVEDWTLRDDGDATIVRWIFALDPAPLFRLGRPLVPLVMGRLFRKAMANLERELTAGRV